MAKHLAQPCLQVNTAVTGWLDDCIWGPLFGADFNPLADESGRVLLLQPVVDPITKVFGMALMEAQQRHPDGQTEVRHHRLSEVPRLMVRESSSVEVGTCIYTRLRDVKEDGLPAFYSPDFLVRTAEATHLVETKAQEQTLHPNVHRKRTAPLAWCDRINQRPPALYGGTDWHDVLLGEDVVAEWQDGHAALGALLQFARLRPRAPVQRQEALW